MKKRSGTLVQEVGQRLRKFRRQLHYTPGQMAEKLGIMTGGYYKNENGENFPGLDTLNRLQKDFDISMDWFIFNKGPMFYKEKQAEKEKPLEKKEIKKTPGPEDTMPEVKELLEHMAKDPLLRHEVMVYFYKYKENKTKESQTSPLSDPQP